MRRSAAESGASGGCRLLVGAVGPRRRCVQQAPSDRRRQHDAGLRDLYAADVTHAPRSDGARPLPASHAAEPPGRGSQARLAHLRRGPSGGGVHVRAACRNAVRARLPCREVKSGNMKRQARLADASSAARYSGVTLAGIGHSLPFEPELLVRGRRRVGDEPDGRLGDPRAVAGKNRGLHERRNHAPFVNELLDPVEN